MQSVASTQLTFANQAAVEPVGGVGELAVQVPPLRDSTIGIVTPALVALPTAVHDDEAHEIDATVAPVQPDSTGSVETATVEPVSSSATIAAPVVVVSCPTPVQLVDVTHETDNHCRPVAPVGRPSGTRAHVDPDLRSTSGSVTLLASTASPTATHVDDTHDTSLRKELVGPGSDHASTEVVQVGETASATPGDATTTPTAATPHSKARSFNAQPPARTRWPVSHGARRPPVGTTASCADTGPIDHARSVERDAS